MNVGKQYENYVETYTELLYHNIALKLSMYHAYVNALTYNKDNVYRSNPLTPLMHESLQVDCVITISKLIEGKRSDRTFLKFLYFLESNLPQIQQKYPALTQEIIEDQKNSLTSIENEIGNILTQRDKYFAHADKKYFFESQAIIDDFPNTYVEIVKILQVLQKMINAHYEIINKNTYNVDMSCFAYGYTEKIINHIIELEKE